MSDTMDRARSGYHAKLRAVAKFNPGIASPQGIENQPINHVRWVDPTKIQGNDYNPNVVAPPEFKLLKVSLLTDGWTQPIVCREVYSNDPIPDFLHYEIVDGFHRWLLGTDPHVFAMCESVPVVVIAPRAGEDQRMSTIRHNRARGSHHVLAMANIVAEMVDEGVSSEKIAEHLQMETEEITRLVDRGNMLKRGPADDFSKGWQPA